MTQAIAPTWVQAEHAADQRLTSVVRLADIPRAYRGTPIGRLLEYHNLGWPLARHAVPELLVGMCMDHRKRLRMPEYFAYVLRTQGASLRAADFAVSYAIAVGGIRAVALIGHTQCGMAGLEARREQFIRGLVEVGWGRAQAEAHFDAGQSACEIGDEASFTLAQAARLRARYPRVRVAPLLYRVEDHRLYLVNEQE